MPDEVKVHPVRRIDRKKFREQIAGYDNSCPFCRDGIEMYCTHGCPACGGTKRIDPQPREDLEQIAEAFRCSINRRPKRGMDHGKA